MKKIKSIVSITLALVLTLSCAVLFTGCGKTEATKNTIDLIKAIGNVDLNSADAINAANDAYTKLSEEERSKVSNYKKLEKAQETYNTVKGVNDDIAAVVNAAETTYSDETFKPSELVGKIDDIKSRYDDLKKYQKETIENYDKIDASVEKLNTYIDNAKKAAAKYLQAFTKTEKGAGATVTAVYCIKQIRNEGEEFHFMALTYKTADGTEKDVYSCARFTQDVSVDAIVERADTFYADAPVSDDSNAKTNGNVTLDLAEVQALIG